MIPPPDSWDPPDGPLYFMKKHFPLTAGTHQLHLRTQVPDSRDPPGRSMRSVAILVANVYIHTGRSVCLQAAAMNCGRVRKGTCRSRGTHVACTRTYSGQGARKKIRPRMCTYGWGLERLLAHTYGQGPCTWLGRNGETTSSSCSWGGNGMRRVHGEATERVGANRLGQNRMRGRVHRDGLDGTGDGYEAWRTAQRRKWTSYVQNGVLLIERGVAYRKTEETDLLRSKRGSC